MRFLRSIGLGMLLCGFGHLYGQATQLGTQTYIGTYTSYALTDLGIFRQVRIQAGSSAISGTRAWEFYEAVFDYDPVWRPYTGGLTLSSYNTTIQPVGGTASALFNTGFGGSAGLMPAITSGNYYTFNITEYSTPGVPANEYMGVLETSYNPVTITSVTQSPGIGAVYPENSVYVTVNISSALSAGEYVYVRYATTVNFASSTLLSVSMTGTTGTVEIPCQSPGTTIYYYAYTSNRTSATILADVGVHGQVVHDMSTLSINNNGGPNYIYTVLPSVGFCGNYYVPSVCYPTIASFVSALNAGTVSCAVVCNVAAGHTETAPAGGINLTQTGTAANTITFIKNGVGANPIVYAPVGTVSVTAAATVADYIFTLNGSDYITIDGIDLVDNNLSGAAMIEVGYGLFKASATDGCNNNIIRNCQITLNQDNYWTATPLNFEFGSTGIMLRNTTRSALTSPLSISTAGGRSDNNQFYGNTISDVINGFVLGGYNDPSSPYTYYDQNNNIGILGNGNSINRFGNDALSGTSRSSGVYAIYQNSITVTDNTIQSSVGGLEPHSNVLYGVFISGPISGNQLQVMSINNNDISLYAHENSTTMKGIKTGSTSGVGADNVNIVGNTIHNCTFYDDPGVIGFPSGEFLAIDNVLNANSVTIADNDITNNVLNTDVTGNLYLIYNSVTSPFTEVSGNYLYNNYKTIASTTGIYYGYYSANGSATGSQEFHDNVIDGFGIPTTQNGSACAVRISSSVNQDKMVYNNQVSNMTTGSSVATMYNCAFYIDAMTSGNEVFGNSVTNMSGSGYMAAYNLASAASTVSSSNVSYVFYNNSVDGMSTTSSNTGAVGIVAYFPTVGSGPFTFYNNSIRNLSSSASFSGYIYGAAMSGGTPGSFITFYGNTFENFQHTGVTSSNHDVMGMILTLNTPVVTIYGNSFNNYSTVATNGQVYGLYLTSTNIMNIYNNFMQRFSTPSTSDILAIQGIYATGSGGTWNVRYNTIAFGYGAPLSTSGTGFGFTGLNFSPALTMNFNNNIVYINGTPAGTGLGSCVRMSSVGVAYTAPLNFMGSDNNYYYINNQTWNYIYTEGGFNTSNINGYAYGGAFTDATRNLNNDECFNVIGPGTGLYRTFMSPAESNTHFDVPPFAGGAVYPDNLKLTPGSTNYAESNAQVIAGILTDYEGDVRSGTTPDVGADEGAFLMQTEACFLLPLELTTFDGWNMGATNLLVWTTETEMNTDHFVVERAADGDIFMAIGEVSAAGISYLPLDYQLVDDAPLHGHNYYRLKMVDIDGTFTYSEVILITLDATGETEVVIYPNPVTDFAHVTIQSSQKDLATLEIIDALGQRVAIQQLNLAEGMNTTVLPLQHLANGTYMLNTRLASGNILEAVRFVKY